MTGRRLPAGINRAVPAVLVALMAGLLLWEAWGDSLTYDEVRYIRAGYCAVTQGVIDVEPTNPAGFKLLGGAGVVALGPAVAARCDGTDARPFFAVPPATLRSLQFSARLPIVALALLLAALVYAWARALFGDLAGAAALALMATEPTILGHGHLVTGDLALTLGVVGCLAAHWRASTTGRRRWLVISGVALGFALLNKVSALYLLPILLLVDAAQPRPGPGRLRRAVAGSALVAAVGWAVVCATYLPFHTSAAATEAWPLSWLLPQSWLTGVQFQLNHVTAGSTYNYLNGETRVGRGFWTYFLEALALKTTLGMLLMVVLALALTVRRRVTALVLYAWLPALVVVVAATAGGIDIGVRYILPVYPLFALGAASLFSGMVGGRGRMAAGALLVLAVGSSLLHAPGHIGYFNEAAGRRPETYLADSNLDWGQDAWRLRDWWEAHGRPGLSTAYFGTLPLRDYGIATRDIALQAPPPAGAIALSLTQVTAYGAGADAGFGVLVQCAGERVGTSVLVTSMPLKGPCAVAHAAR